MFLATTESEALHWQYYANPATPVGSRVSAASYLRCSVIATDGDGEWVSLYMEGVAPTELPSGQKADYNVAVLANGTEFRILHKSLHPKVDIVQTVPFKTAGGESLARLTIFTDGRIRCQAISTAFSGKTQMPGAISAHWYNLKN